MGRSKRPCSCPYFMSSIMSKCFSLFSFHKQLVHHLKHLPLELLYLVSISSLGFIILKGLSPRSEYNSRNIDLFFTSVSAATLSSMSTIEMEVFSNSQLIVMIFLMFVGGEILISMVGLHIRSFKMRRTHQSNNRVQERISNNGVNLASSNSSSPSTVGVADQIEMDVIGLSQASNPTEDHNMASLGSSDHLMLADSIKFLGFVVLAYLLIIHAVGVSLVLLVTSLVPSAKNLLKDRGLDQLTFAIFTIVSTFANCGFIPTNENMIVFSKNSGLLLVLIPQALFGNTLFPSCLRLILWFFAKYFNKFEAKYSMQNTREVKYYHLLSGLHSWLLAATVVGFLLIQFIMFCALEWRTAAFNGLNTFQKIVGVLFECTSSRFTGETIVDLSTIAPAMLLLFIVMMLVLLLIIF